MCKVRPVVFKEPSASGEQEQQQCRAREICNGSILHVSFRVRLIVFDEAFHPTRDWAASARRHPVMCVGQIEPNTAGDMQAGSGGELKKKNGVAIGPYRGGLGLDKSKGGAGMPNNLS